MITKKEYHNDTTRCTASMLKKLDKSPRLYEHAYINGKREPTSAAMKFGTAVHMAALEPQKYDETYLISPYDNFRTKEAKEWKRGIEEGGGEVLSIKEYAAVADCALALELHPIIGSLLKAEGQVETVVEFEHGDIPCKFMPDKLIPGRIGCVLDIKTTAEFGDREFERNAAKFGYHLQAAHYLHGASAAGIADPMFVMGVIETVSPYRVRAYQYEHDALTNANHYHEVLLAEWSYRTKNNDWAETGEADLISISLPNWL